MNTGNQDDSSARIEALEIRIAHLENGLQQLGDALFRQQQELSRVIDLNRQLLEEIEARTDPSGDAATRVEIPPHY
jgi:uncharacterized coiled-coil protein SlyX